MTSIPNVRPGALSGLGLTPLTADAPAPGPDASAEDVPTLSTASHDNIGGTPVLVLPTVAVEQGDGSSEQGVVLGVMLPPDLVERIVDAYDHRSDDDEQVGVTVIVYEDGVYVDDAPFLRIPEGLVDSDDHAVITDYPTDGTVDDVKAWVEKSSGPDRVERARVALEHEGDHQSRKTLLKWLQGEAVGGAPAGDDQPSTVEPLAGPGSSD